MFAARWKMLVVVTAATLAVAGCGSNRAANADPQFHATSDGSLELQFPADWYENKEKHPYELQYFAPAQQMTVGVFVYKKEDLASDLTPDALLKTQIEDIKSKRKNFKVVEAQTAAQHDGKKLTTVVYSGDKEASKYFYRFTMIEFDKNPNVLAIAIQVAIPSSWAKQKPILEAITKSARIKAEQEKPDGAARP